jgi:23S rRNA (uracil1939-C5)-methyltransferase
MRKNKTHTIVENVEIIDIANEGKGIAKVDELVVFVEKVVPGDIVDIEIYKQKKNLAEAKVSKFVQFSNKRAEPFCEHFGVCGGCKWQNMSYANQLQYKQKTVVDALTRLCKIDLPEIDYIKESESTDYYRNKMEYTFSNKRWLTIEEIQTEEKLEMNALGFHIPKKFDKILDIQKCHLQDTRANYIRNAVREFALKNEYTFYDIRNHVGLLRNLIIRNTSINEWMVVVAFAENDTEKINALMQYLQEQFSFITSLQYLVNTKKNDTIYDQEVITYAGNAYIHEMMKDLNGEEIKFRISAKSFYQTNSDQAALLYKIAAELCEFKGDELVYDLYTGTGTIANYIARSAKKVIGIEYVDDAIKDAKVNSSINSIDNTLFFAGDMKDLLNDEFITEHGKPNIIITDPPRAGMHEDVCKQLLKIAAEKIVYISCNVATQARDLAILDEKYKVMKVQPVDMFPQTEHVENAVLLVLR